MHERFATLLTLSLSLFIDFASGQTKVDFSNQVRLPDTLGIGAPCSPGTPAGTLCVSKNLVLRSTTASRWGLIPGGTPSQAEESQDLAGGYYPVTFWIRDTDGSPCTTVWSSRTVGTPFCSPGKRQIASAVFDNGGSALSTARDSCTLVTTGARISSVTMLASSNGSAKVDVRTVAVPNYAGPSSAQTIAGSEMPTLSGTSQYQDSVLTGWNKEVAANSVMCFHLSNPTAITWLAVSVEGI